MTLLKYILNYKFRHLQVAKQTYTEHMKDSFYYGIVCLKLSIYFLIHGIYPDVLENTSIELSQLSTLIKMKYKSRI